jgi:hypothetical protein
MIVFILYNILKRFLKYKTKNGETLSPKIIRKITRREV